MLLEALRVLDFRNLRQVDLAPHPRFNLLTGANGQGKTNLLESIYLLSAVKSFRRKATNQNLIRFGADQASLMAHIERGGHQRKVQIDITPRGKQVYLNDESVRKISDFFGTLNVVIFGPDDIDILKGSPSGRRQFIDRAIFNAHPAYGTESRHYDDVLSQRNALLKEDYVDDSLLQVYNEQFVEWGARVLRRRLDFIKHFQPVLHRIFASIFSPDLRADLSYDATWIEGSLDVDQALEDDSYLTLMLKESLRRTADEERARGYSVVGPHRDDLAATLNDRAVRAFASQGQTRAFVLAMKIAEITYLEERYHFAPILLLDDVSSELDRERNRFLFDFLTQRDGGQVFITTTHRDHILLDDELRVFGVHDGHIEEVDDA